MRALAYREGEPADIPYVITSWINSYTTAHAAGPIPMHMYSSLYHKIVPWILQRPGVELWVAYHPGLEQGAGDIHGWACVEYGGEFPLLHFVEVKNGRRQCGIGRGLLAAAGFDTSQPFVYTFKTAVVSRLKRAGKVPAHARFNPLSVRFARREKSSPIVEHRRRASGKTKNTDPSRAA